MGRNATLLVLGLAVLPAAGCLTHEVLSAWDESARTARLGLRARPAGGSKLEILWRETVPDATPSSSGALSLDTKLDDCDAVHVMATDAREPATLGEGNERLFAGSLHAEGERDDARATLEGRECTVLLYVEAPGKGRPHHTVHASSGAQELGSVDIPAHRDPRWLALVPPAFVADVATFPLYLGLVVCLLPTPENPCLVWLDEKY
jgi:hypothetical protein